MRCGPDAAFAGLAVGLQAEAQLAQQPSDQLLTGGETALCQGAGQVPLTPADPQQRRLGVATNSRLHQFGQRLQQPRFGFGLWPTAATRAAHAPGDLVLPVTQLAKATADGAAGDARHRRHRGHATAACSMSLTRRPQSTLAFAEEWGEGFEAGLDGDGVNHPATLVRPADRFLPKTAIRLFRLRP